MVLKSLRNAARLGAFLVAMGVGSAFALTGTQFGQVQIAGGQFIPAKNDLSFIAFVNGTDDVIHTENAYNSALGVGNGYTIQNNSGYFLVNFSNFANAKSGDTFTVLLTSKSENFQGALTGSVPAGLTATDAPVSLAPSTAPLTPENVRAQRSDNGVVVSWNTEANTTYRVYRADLPSGANNGASRGIYTKVAEGVTGTFLDTTVEQNLDYWYIVVAENKNGVLSAHSKEVRVLENNIASGFATVEAGGLMLKDALLSSPSFDKGSGGRATQPAD